MTGKMINIDHSAPVAEIPNVSLDTSSVETKMTEIAQAIDRVTQNVKLDLPTPQVNVHVPNAPAPTVNFPPLVFPEIKGSPVNVEVKASPDIRLIGWGVLCVGVVSIAEFIFKMVILLFNN